MKTIRILPKFFTASTASLALAIAIASSSAHAQTTYTWSGTSLAPWSAASSWSPAGGPPGAIDSVTFSTGGTSPAGNNNAGVDGTFTLNNFTSATGAQTQVVATVTSAQLTINGTLNSSKLTRFRSDGGKVVPSDNKFLTMVANTVNVSGNTLLFGEFDPGRALADLDIGATTITNGAIMRWSTGSLATPTATSLTFGTGGGNFVTNNVDGFTQTVSLGALSGTTGVVSSANSGNSVNSNTTLVINQSGTSSYSGLLVDRSTSGGIVDSDDGTSSLALRKIGVGTQTLGGTNTYAGITEVNDGTLFINGNQAGATGAVTVAAAGILGGSGGIIGGATTVSGTLAPGNNDIGILSFSATTTLPTVNNALTLLDGANTIMEIDGLIAGTGHDQIALTGAANVITYNGTLTLDIGTVLTNGTTYDLFSFAAESNPAGPNFDTVAFAGGIYSDPFTDTTMTGVWTATSMSQLFTFTESTGDLTVAAVPEPTTVAMLLGGAGMLALLRRRRK